MTNKSSLEIVKSFSDAMEKMHFDEGLTYCAEDIEYINSPNTVSNGHAGVRAVLEPFFAPIEENEFILKRQLQDGNIVVLELLDRHRVGQEWFELPVTGVYELQDGKIVYWREYFDLETIKNDMERIFGAAS
jgi:limonene-1,2-epoxide hydrolase